jgi:hypothetical protein
MSSNKERPSRLSLGQLNRLQESTQRNADDIFGDLVNLASSPKSAAPVPVPVFRAIGGEPAKEPATAPAPTVATSSPELVAVTTPAKDPAEAAPQAPTGGEGERGSAPAPKTSKHRKHSPKGEPCTAHPGESKRENLVSVRFTPEQMEDLEHWAEAERLQLAVMCRDLILKEMGRNRALIQKIREFRQGLTMSA